MNSNRTITEVVIGLLIFTAGSGFIICVSPDSWENSIDKLILWLTAVIVAFYTYETYRLRVVSQEQTKFAQRAYRKDHTPIVIPDPEKNTIPVHKETNTAQWGISNISGGNSALNIQITGKENGRVSFFIGNEERHELPRLDGAGVGMASSGIPIILERLKSPLEEDVFEINYRDIFGNNWFTGNIRFTKHGDGTYKIDENAWSLSEPVI